MKQESIKQLKTLLIEWFDSVDLTQRNIFNQNEIASLLKRQLKKIKADVSAAFSSAQFANYASTLPGVGLLNALARGVDK